LKLWFSRLFHTDHIEIKLLDEHDTYADKLLSYWSKMLNKVYILLDFSLQRIFVLPKKKWMTTFFSIFSHSIISENLEVAGFETSTLELPQQI